MLSKASVCSRDGKGVSWTPPPLATNVWWPTLETCSDLSIWRLEEPPPHIPRSNICWWTLKQVWFASGRYASHWNVFLFLVNLVSSRFRHVAGDSTRRDRWRWLLVHHEGRGQSVQSYIVNNHIVVAYKQYEDETDAASLLANHTV